MIPVESAGGSASDIPVLRLTTPDDILSAIPYLLRFHPEESLVVLVLSRRQLVVTARVDLGPDPWKLGDYLGRVALEHGGDTLLVVAYSAQPEVAGRAVDVLVEALAPLPVAEALVVDGSRWWTRFSHDGCRPEDGRPYDAEASEVALRAVVAGLPALPNRAALAASITGPEPRELPELTEAFEEALLASSELDDVDRQSRMSLLIEQFCLRGQLLTTQECAELAVLAYEIDLRDRAAELIDLENAEIHVALWHQVVAKTIAPFEMAPLCLLGLAAWVSGNGSLQVVCIERAERINPDYSLLAILAEINARCLPPSAWTGMRVA